MPAYRNKRPRSAEDGDKRGSAAGAAERGFEAVRQAPLRRLDVNTAPHVVTSITDRALHHLAQRRSTVTPHIWLRRQICLWLNSIATEVHGRTSWARQYPYQEAFPGPR